MNAMFINTMLGAFQTKRPKKYMNSFKEIIDSDFLTWLEDYDLKYTQAPIKTDNGALDILYNDKFCLKIYDRLGHGFGVSTNVSEHYGESMYEKGEISIHWVFKYFQIEQTANFLGRSKIGYQYNLPKLVDDIKLIVPFLNKMTPSDWKNLREWIKNEARIQFV